MAVKKTIAVLGPDNVYLSHCTWNRALKLLESDKAIRINATTIRLKQTKKERVRKKHSIIADAKRICYICNARIPEDEVATIDHIIPRSRDKKADVYDNMRCCCNRCNNDKANRTLSEYVKHILKNRDNYYYITDKRLEYLKNYAKYYEDAFYSKKSVEALISPYRRRKRIKSKRRRRR